MAMTTCKECGNEVSDQAETCPHCGAPLKAGKKKAKRNKRGRGCASVFLGIILLGVALIWGLSDAFQASSSTSTSDSASSEEPTPSLTTDEYQEQAPIMNYREARLENYETDKPLRFRGEVLQFPHDTAAIVVTKKNDMGMYVDNHTWLRFDSEPEAIEGELLWIYGLYSGTRTYASLAGRAEVPLIDVEHYGVLQQE